MSDEKRVDFLAELMDLSCAREHGAKLTAEQTRRLEQGSAKIFTGHEFYRRMTGPAGAFRRAVDEAIDEDKRL